MPQKRWNVYNFDNRERVRRDEEAAAREDYERQQEQRQRDADVRLTKLREAAHAKRGGGDPSLTDPNSKQPDHAGETLTKPSNHADDIQHMKLFEGLVSFQRVDPGASGSKEFKGPNEVDKKIFRGDRELERLYKRATKEATRVGKDGIEADDEHYKLGYGCLGRDKKRPWYLTKTSLTDEPESATSGANQLEGSVRCEKKQKKTIAELREERLMREQQERERARRILAAHSNGQPKDVGARNSGRRPYYNSSYGNAR